MKPPVSSDALGNPVTEIERKYLPTPIAVYCTTCSGSSFLRFLYQFSGYDVRHEEFGEDGGVGYNLITPDFDDVTPGREIHMMRHPLHVCRSMTGLSLRFLHKKTYIQNVCGITDEEIKSSALTGIMKFVLKWNRHIAKSVDWHFRVEDLTNPDMLTFLAQVTGADLSEETLPRCPRGSHKPSSTLLTWDDLYEADADLAESVVSLSRDYGYGEPV